MLENKSEHLKVVSVLEACTSVCWAAMPKVCQRFSLPHINGTFQSGQDNFCALFDAKPGSDLCALAFMRYVPSPLTTHSAYLIACLLHLICCLLTQCIVTSTVTSIHNQSLCIIDLLNANWLKNKKRGRLGNEPRFILTHTVCSLEFWEGWLPQLGKACV